MTTDLPELRYRGRDVPDFAALVASYSARDLDSPRRSTVPLLAYWRDGATALARFHNAIAAPANDHARLDFEHAVPVAAGRGLPSQTDLLIESETSRIGVEAKFHEPQYETVSQWLGRDRDGTPTKDETPTNRDLVLGGWLRLIESAIGCSIDPDAVADVTYQLVHRTASVCSGAAGRAIIVAYHLFIPDGADPSDHVAPYRRQLQRLAEIVGDRLGVWLIRTPVHGTAEYDALCRRWTERKERELADDVRAGLIGGALFEFGADHAERIRT